MRPATWKIAALLCLCAAPALADEPGILSQPGCTGAALAQIEQGCARVYPLPGVNADFPALLTTESKARKANTGLWADKKFAVHTPETAGQLIDSYGIVEGIVTATAKVKGRIYLNFGTDWKTDFTVELTNDAAKQLQARAIDWQQLQGQKIRTRGWVFWRFGPTILTTTDAQVEVMQVNR